MDTVHVGRGPTGAHRPVMLTPLHESTVFEMIPMPAFIKDADLVHTHANQAFCDLLGLPREEVVGRRAAELGLFDASGHEDAERRLLATGGVSGHPFRMWRQSGPPLSGEILKMRLDGSGAYPASLLGVIMDRSTQIRAEQRLRDVETLQRVVLDSISDAIFMLDGDGRLTFAAPTVETIFGMDPVEAMARGGLGNLFGCGECALKVLPRDRETSNIECCAVRPDGTRRDLLVSVKPVEIGASRWLVTCRDVTERVDAQRRLKASMEKTIEVLCATVEKRDPYVIGHQDRVADLAVAIGRRMGLDEDRLEGLRLAAIVHDVGKINVPSEILSKPGKLSPPEMAIIRNHPETGYEILKDIDFPWPIARMVREHHEAIDGSGYPLGLTGDRLLLESRILSVADVMEAVTSHRPYRPGLGLPKALEILREMRGTKLDPDAVDTCLALIEGGEVAVPGWTA